MTNPSSHAPPSSRATLGRPLTRKPQLELIVGGAANPRAPLRELYETYGSSVYNRCVFILRDRHKAEDAMQDVFAKALEHWDGFRGDASPLTWLTRIATHHCLNLLRSERAPWRDRFRREATAREEGTGGPQVFEMRDLVRRLIGRLDAETQAAAIHYHVDEMTLDEVARAIDRSVPTVRKRLDEFAALAAREVGS